MTTDQNPDNPKCINPECNFTNYHGDNYGGLCLPCWNRKNQEYARRVKHYGPMPLGMTILAGALASLKEPK